MIEYLIQKKFSDKSGNSIKVAGSHNRAYSKKYTHHETSTENVIINQPINILRTESYDLNGETFVSDNMNVSSFCLKQS